MAASRLSVAARRRRRSILLAVATLAAIAGALALNAAGAVDRLEYQSIDTRFAVRGSQGAPDDVVVVGVDAKTFRSRAEGGIGEQWPFARRRHAQVVDELVRDGARVIAYDVQFTEPSPTGEQSDDERLFQSVFEATRAGYPVVLATTEVDPGGSTAVFGDDETRRSVGAGVGNAIMPGDPGGVVRRVPYEHDGLRSFAVATARSVQGRNPPRSAFSGRGPLIDFPGPPGTIPTYSFADVASGSFKRGTFNDKVVVVGAVAPSLQDLSATSTSGSGLTPGPELQAAAIQTILDDFPLKETPDWLAIVLMVVFALIPPLLGMRRLPIVRVRVPPVVGFLIALVLGGLYLVLAQVAFNSGRVLPVALPLTALVLSAIFTLAALLIVEASDKRRIHDLFARFVPEKVVDQVVANADEELRLGGESRRATVLFSDLRGFTTYSESRPPADVIDILNGYLSEMTDAILDAGGTLVAYMGDGIMAVFGAPLDQADHCDRALRAGRDMLDRLDRYNQTELAGQDPFRMGVGLNTGEVISGNVGSERRLEYTVIGDITNTAARIEGLTKGTPYGLLMSQATVDGLAETPSDIEFHEDLAIRGRSDTVRLWGVRSPVAPDPSAPGGQERLQAEGDAATVAT